MSCSARPSPVHPATTSIAATAMIQTEDPLTNVAPNVGNWEPALRSKRYARSWPARYTGNGCASMMDGRTADCTAELKRKAASQAPAVETSSPPGISFPRPCSTDAGCRIDGKIHKEPLSLASDFKNTWRVVPDLHLVLEGHAPPGRVRNTIKPFRLHVEIENSPSRWAVREAQPLHELRHLGKSRTYTAQVKQLLSKSKSDGGTEEQNPEALADIYTCSESTSISL